jgi:hypothetical protein
MRHCRYSNYIHNQGRIEHLLGPGAEILYGPFDKTCFTKPLARLADRYIFLTISQIINCIIKL